MFDSAQPGSSLAALKALICNGGSSSIKFSLIEAEHERFLAEGGVDWSSKPGKLTIRRAGQPDVKKECSPGEHSDAISQIVSELQQGSGAPLRSPQDIGIVGHRIVHGGERYTSAVRITPDVCNEIQKLAELAPLHNPASLKVIEAVTRILPKVPQVAAFDTGFHATMSETARTYPVPRKWTIDWHLRRYGFHGLSHSYCTRRAGEMLPNHSRRLIIAHLGNGASISAVRDGKCLDNSMGFTPLDGLMMGTRSGSVDPGMLIYVLRHKGLNVDGLDHALNSESGLLGVSGVSADMRQVLAAAAENNPQARLAVDLYVHRIQQVIGAMAAILDGVDTLIFTAGVGENAPSIRQLACANLRHLGLELDESANAACKPDADVATRQSSGRILVIATREDLTILREIKALLQTGN